MLQTIRDGDRRTHERAVGEQGPSCCSQWYQGSQLAHSDSTVPVRLPLCPALAALLHVAFQACPDLPLPLQTTLLGTLSRAAGSW